MSLTSARKRFILCDTTGTQVWPIHTDTDNTHKYVYSRLQGESDGQLAQFQAIVPVTAGSHTFVVKAEDALANATATWYDRNLSVFAA